MIVATSLGAGEPSVDIRTLHLGPFLRIAFDRIPSSKEYTAISDPIADASTPSRKANRIGTATDASFLYNLASARTPTAAGILYNIAHGIHRKTGADKHRDATCPEDPKISMHKCCGIFEPQPDALTLHHAGVGEISCQIICSLPQFLISEGFSALADSDLGVRCCQARAKPRQPIIHEVTAVNHRVALL